MYKQLEAFAPDPGGPNCPQCGTLCESRFRAGEMYAWCDACDWNSITQDDEDEEDFLVGISVDFLVDADCVF